MALKLHTYPGGYRAQKALVTAAFNGVQIEVPPFEFGKDNKTPEFLELFPTGKVPALETEHGGIFESNAIARYVARARPACNLYGRSVFEAARIDSWLDYCSFEVEPPTNILRYNAAGYIQVDQQTLEEGRKDALKALQVLDAHLLHHTYLVGHCITLADIVIAVTLTDPLRTFFDAEFRNQLPNLMRWYSTIANQAPFKKVMGEVSFSTASASGQQQQGGKKGKQQKQQEDQKEQKQQGGKKGKQQKQQEEAPQQQQQQPAAAEAEPEEEPENEFQEKPKGPHPLSLLPPSSMQMDNWKRVFSNNPPEEAMSQFWQMYDPQGYSIWFADYNYDDENRVLFMTANLVGGYFQRLDKLRKWAFGSLSILSQEAQQSPFKLRACWLFRGQEIPDDMKECPDSEYYTWRKANTEDESQRALIHEHWAAPERILGMHINERRIYK